MPANTGPGVAEPACAAAATSDASPLQRHQLRHGRAGGQQPRVAGVHAAEQGLDEPVDDLVAEPGGDQVADRRRPRRRRAAGRGSRGAAARRRRRTAPPRPRPARTSAGTPITERGSGRSAPRVQTEDEVVAGWTTGSPSSRARSTPSGRRVEHRLRAEVDLDAPDRPGQQLAADRGARPRAPATSRPAAARSRAAVSPAMPPPTTTVRRRGSGMRPACHPAARNQPRGRAVVRPCAPLASSRSRPPPCCSLSRPARAGPTATRPRPPPPWTAARRAGPPATWPSRHREAPADAGGRVQGGGCRPQRGRPRPRSRR